MTLGDRMKKFESVSTNSILPKVPVIFRIDGNAFHTFTRGFKRFDDDLRGFFIHATKQLFKKSGAILAYHQSDEISFLITDLKRNESQLWFDGEINKIVSLSASIFTTHFANIYWNWCNENNRDYKFPYFDSRVFNVPLEDVPNYFIWRQRDWERNSIQMLAQSQFSHKELMNKSTSNMHDMLFEKGINWNDLEPWKKNGTFVLKDEEISEKLNYETLKEKLDNLLKPGIIESKLMEVI